MKKFITLTLLFISFSSISQNKKELEQKITILNKELSNTKNNLSNTINTLSILTTQIADFTKVNSELNSELNSLKKQLDSVLTPIKQEYYSKFRLLFMRLIFSLKLDVYPCSISPLG